MFHCRGGSEGKGKRQTVQSIMPVWSCMPFSACNRQVDALDRRQTNLQQVPQEALRYARTLEELLLDMNHIKELPKELFRLHRLRILGLSDNDIYRVPPEIASLGSLEELNLSRNDISDLPDEIRECKELSRLELSSNPFTRLPQAISQLGSLSHLGLNDVSLTQLPADIGSLSNLRSLEVRENLIRTLPQSICQLVKLQVLDLGQNELDQLPGDIGALVSLRELYVDANDLESLPDQITLCRSLEQIDVSENKLMLLPEDFGELERLTDVNVSQNCLQIFPHSIGRLHRLSILKAEKNAITQLTMSIGSCKSLQELVLTENLLTEIPSSIGNLQYLKILNVDKNQLTSIPTTIGGCQSLSVLSLRDNQLSELPMDVGKCDRITVMDLCSNRLSYLPFTIKVLNKLQALWLSENQTQALLKLQEEREPRTGVKVLTCYLLPQREAAMQEPEQNQNRSFIGGPKVHFGDQADTTQDEERALPVGEFTRHDTPHPKPHAAKLKKNTIDGHVIHHEDDQPSTLALKKKPSMDATASPSGSTGQPSLPRSALRQYPQPERSPSSATGVPPSSSVDNNNSQDQHPTRSVLFSSSTKASPEDENGPIKLKRMNTPHYKVIRGVNSSSSAQDGQGPKVRRIRVVRDASGNLGLSIAGGLESTPFKDDDRGLFVSKVQNGGPAEKAGLRVGDKLLRVNDTDVLHVAHETAVKAMKEGRDAVELSILRVEDRERIIDRSPQGPATLASPDASFSSENDSSKETIAVTMRRDKTGSPGFAISGGIGGGTGGIFISQITRGGAADLDGKLQIGDRVVSIDGTKMRDTRHDQAVALLTGMADKEVHLVVQRDRSAPSLLSPLPFTPTISNQRTPSPAASPVYGTGDPSWDGKTENVVVHRDGECLGLSVVGGSDHVSHPFGVDAPGVFISKIALNSAAHRSQRLRIGDRIIKVNDIDVTESKHATAVEALKSSGSTVRLVVRHDTQPSGLREVIVRKRGDGPLGISIHGGVGSDPAYAGDIKDEGIFIQKVETGSISAVAGLIPGQRIVEVNGESLLGTSQEEAASALKRSHELRLLVCDGYNRRLPFPSKSSNSSLPPINSSSSSAVKTSSSSLKSPEPVSILSDVVEESPSSPPSSPILSSHELSRTTIEDAVPSFDSTPLATSSPLPSAIPKPSRMPPPVAPKPMLRTSQASNISSPEVEMPERMGFSSKLSHFEKKMELASNGTTRPNTLPDKKPLLNQDDIKRLKEAEAKKVNIPSLDSPENNDNFLSMIEESRIPRGPGSIRTKKAENIAIAQGLIEDDTEGLSEAEKLEREMTKRQQWRKERYESLRNTKGQFDELMERVTPILKTIEDGQERSTPIATPLAEEIEYADAEL